MCSNKYNWSCLSVTIFIIMCLSSLKVKAQSDIHYTMFMYNKLLYNPGYTGSKDLTSINATYRNQWVGIDGAPKTLNLTVDGLIGTYMLPFRHVALGLSLSNEKVGVESSTNIMAYYAYRVKLGGTILSLGLSGGAKLYSANYNELNPFMSSDPNLTKNVSNSFLPNFGTGFYWYNSSFYFGGSVPNLLQNYYNKLSSDKNNVQAREIRGYYINTGYVFPVNEQIKLQPQILFRYAGNATYKLPINTDFNLSMIALDRFMLGFTYRTDQSLEAIIHVQVFSGFNLGYAYDYVLSQLNGYAGATHEIVLGYEFIKDKNKYSGPRFISAF